MWGVAFGLLLMTTGVVLIAVGTRSLDAAQSRHTALLQSAFVTSPSSAQFASFTQSGGFAYAMDEPVYTGVYLWNLTNAAQVLAGSEAPKVVQIGPYVYAKKTRKVNVTFHATLPPTTRGMDDASPLTYDFAYVSYGVVASYAFDATRSNGSETDRVVTLNATYARMLAKHRALGYSERLLVAQYAQQHLIEYVRHLREEFIADTKQRALQHFLPLALETVTRESVAPAIQRQRDRIDAASIPANLVRMYAVARTEAIPQVLRDVRKDITDRFQPGILQRQLDLATRHALPRVLSNAFERLKVESVPVMLQRQMELQKLRHVPVTLSSLAAKLSSLAFPYVMDELFARACLEAVPFVLRTIKLEVIARDTEKSLNQADAAQNNVVEAWRLRSSGDRVDFDAWIDDTPTGYPRTGFELHPPTDALQLSHEVATLLLGSKTSNKRFSIVDYDVAKAATYPLNVPTETPVGFAIWKHVIAMNETAITYVMDGVNNDVARPSDYLTRDQVLFVRDYLIQWAKRDVVARDRERFWRTNFVRRTVQSDFNEPSVDLDMEKTGIQMGYNLRASGASTSGVTAAIAQQLWNAKDAFSFTNVEGFTLWYNAAILSLASASRALITGVSGLTDAQVTEISTWLKALLTDGFVWRRALRHWADGTCLDSLKLPRQSCLLYDLEPHIPGVQAGFEMNAQGDTAIVVPQALREDLWDKSKPSSFLYAVQAADTSTGFGRWMQAVRVGDTADIVKALSTTYPTFGAVGAAAIVQWINQWSANPLHVLNIQNWWRTATCWPREQLAKSTITPVTALALSACTPSYKEDEVSIQVLVAGAPQSPFATTQRVLKVQDVQCDYVAETSKYTKTDSSYEITVKEYSCEAFSTEVSDDHGVGDFKTGFELAPLVPLADGALRPSLAVTSALWNPSNAFSFLHRDGYKQWVFDYTKSTVAVRTALVDTINLQLLAACAKLSGAGLRSGIFNTTLYGTDANCGAVTTDQVVTLQKWVSAIAKSAWIESALLDQWRRGDFAVGIDIEPYRPAKQSGWELSTGCACSLTSVQGTKYDVPRAALSVWQADTHKASFLTTKGYALWTDVMDAVQGGDASEITTRKQVLLTACGLGAWAPWLDRVVAWLDAWTRNEHLLRDVLGHWLHGTCPTPSSLATVRVVSEPAPVSIVQSSCPPVKQRYQITLSDTLDSLLQTASRPVFAQFFDAEVVDKAALVQPTKELQETETIITCDYVAADRLTVSTQTRVRVKNFPSCNFLSVLSDGTTAAVPIVRQETHFEMNRTSETAYISMDVAFALWQNSTATAWAFTNVNVFLTKWQRAIDRSDALNTLATSLNAAIVATRPSALQDVAQYLKMWQTSSDSVQEIGKLWLRSAAPYYDLDIKLDGSQGGFELFPSTGWQTRFDAASSVGALPSLSQAQLLWDTTNDYSFLNTNADLMGGLPMGFHAWREMYDGIDYSSERLIRKYPEVAVLELDGAMAYRLSSADRTALRALIVSATKLSSDQIRAIAAWLMVWSENAVLRDYVLESWATGLTPRGEEGAVVDLSLYIPPRFDLQQLGRSAIPADKLTVTGKASVLNSLPKAVRRKLWDVTTTGSLLNPVSRDLWCLLELPTLGVCPHVLDEIGLVNDTSFTAFTSIVQPVVQDLETITRGSNLTTLALQYFVQQFGMTEDQTLAIASWWRSVPTTSSFFQALQAQRWQLTTDTLASQDGLRFGFGLATVFVPSDGRLSRRATLDELVSNPMLVNCKISLDLVIVLWRQTNPSSFIHETGRKLWLEFAEQKAPRRTTLFFKSISDADAVVKNIVNGIAAASASCTVEAIADWLLSWGRHPLTRQFVESLWFRSSSSTGSRVNPSALLQAWPVDSGVSLAPRSAVVLRVHARLAELVFDSNESIALTNLTMGFAVWRALLTDCTSTTTVAFKCTASRRAGQSQQVSNAAAALGVLSRNLVNRVLAIDSSLNVTRDSVEYAIRTVIVPWLLYWLDHELLLRFVLTQASKVDPSLQGQTEMLTYGDFPAIQFTSATFSKVSYTLPKGTTDSDASYTEHVGVPSERLTVPRRVFDPVNGSVVGQNVSGLAGFPELASFCTWHAYDRVYAYDTPATCSLGTAYTMLLSEANAILSTLTDTIDWVSFDDSLRVKRAALLLDAFLAQPFQATRDCSFAMANVAIAYAFPTATTQGACTTTADGVVLDLPLLSAMGLTSSLARTQDFQAFLKYIATKFVYEPSVLGLSARDLTASDLSQPSAPLDLWTLYPIGGYLAVQSVANVVSPTSTAMSLWQTSAAAPGLDPTVNTYLVPSRSDPSLLSAKKDRVLGELVAINGSTRALILGASFRLSLGHFTDGSQFVTSVLASRHDPSFPPAKLRFYWEYAQRIVHLSYVTNVTRFGIPLLRFTVENWQEPTNLPSGLDAAARVDGKAPQHSVNVSTLFDDLPLVLSAGPTTPTAGSFEQARETAIDIDPVTGAVYHRRLAWQLTTRISASESTRDGWHGHLQAGWLPVAWVREHQSVSPSKALEFVSMTVKSGPFAAEKLAIWGVVGGSAYVVVGVVVSVVYARRARMARLRKQQSVMPAGSLLSTNGLAKPPVGSIAADTTSDTINKQVDATSDVGFATSGLVTIHTSPRARKRTVTRVETIVEDRDETPEIQQA